MSESAPQYEFEPESEISNSVQLVLESFLHDEYEQKVESESFRCTADAEIGITIERRFSMQGLFGEPYSLVTSIFNFEHYNGVRVADRYVVGVETTIEASNGRSSLHSVYDLTFYPSGLCIGSITGVDYEMEETSLIEKWVKRDMEPYDFEYLLRELTSLKQFHDAERNDNHRAINPEDK